MSETNTFLRRLLGIAGTSNPDAIAPSMDDQVAVRRLLGVAGTNDPNAIAPSMSINMALRKLVELFKEAAITPDPGPGPDPDPYNSIPQEVFAADCEVGGLPYRREGELAFMPNPTGYPSVPLRLIVTGGLLIMPASNVENIILEVLTVGQNLLLAHSDLTMQITLGHVGGGIVIYPSAAAATIITNEPHHNYLQDTSSMLFTLFLDAPNYTSECINDLLNFLVANDNGCVLSCTSPNPPTGGGVIAYGQALSLGCTLTMTPPQNMRVSGAGTSAVNLDFVLVGFSGFGTPTYAANSGGVDYHIIWSGDAWLIYNTTSLIAYYEGGFGDTPDLVTTWVAISGSAPLPTITAI